MAAWNDSPMAAAGGWPQAAVRTAPPRRLPIVTMVTVIVVLIAFAVAAVVYYDNSRLLTRVQFETLVTTLLLDAVDPPRVPTIDVVEVSESTGIPYAWSGEAVVTGTWAIELSPGEPGYPPNLDPTWGIIPRRILDCYLLESRDNARVFLRRYFDTLNVAGFAGVIEWQETPRSGVRIGQVQAADLGRGGEYTVYFAVYRNVVITATRSDLPSFDGELVDQWDSLVSDSFKGAVNEALRR